MDFKLILLTFVTIINAFGLLMAFSTFASDKKSKANLYFALLTLTTILWINFGFIGDIFSDQALLFKKLNIATIPIFLLFSYFFSLYFPIKTRKDYFKFDILVITIGVLIASITMFSTRIVQSISIRDWGVDIEYGDASYLFYIWVAISTALIFANLFIKYHGLDKENRKKIILFLSGICIFASFNLTFNIIVPLVRGTTQFYQFGDYSVIIMLCFTAYAIIKHQLFNIKVIVTETTVIALSIGLLVEVFLSNTIIEGALKGIIWILATYGGYVLIKSVKKEIKQKEDLQILSKKLDEANQHLEELDAAKDNFLSMAAHELNTPIAAIEGYLSMIIDEKMGGEINPKMKSYLGNVYVSSKRLASLVKDLLNVSRIESNRVHLLYAESYIETVIEQSITEVKIKADEVGHKLTFEKPKVALPKTWLDVDRITEVVINIIGNAIKYTEPPGKIVVSAHTDGNKIVVAIEDNGRGIPKDKSDHVFEKFVQVNVLKDQVKGTGLGMFITKNLIELHNGKVWFQSSTDEKDHGTTFYFSLPILKKKPFDPHEGEGALFQTGKPKDNEKIVGAINDEHKAAATGKVAGNVADQAVTGHSKTEPIIKPEEKLKV